MYHMFMWCQQSGSYSSVNVYVLSDMKANHYLESVKLVILKIMINLFMINLIKNWNT